MNPCLTILLSLVPSLHLVGICPPCQAVRSLSIWLQSRNPSGEPWKETPSNQPRGRGLRAFALRKLRELLPQSPHGCIVVLIPPVRVLAQCHLCLHFRAITNRFLPFFSLTFVASSLISFLSSRYKLRLLDILLCPCRSRLDISLISFLTLLNLCICIIPHHQTKNSLYM